MEYFIGMVPVDLSGTSVILEVAGVGTYAGTGYSGGTVSFMVGDTSGWMSGNYPYSLTVDGRVYESGQFTVTATAQPTARNAPGVRANLVVVRSLADFPPPVSDAITVVDDVIYEVNGPVDIGPNRIICGFRNAFHGLDRTNDRLISSTPGALFTCVNKSILTLENMTLKCATGSLLDASSTISNQSIAILQCTFQDFVSLGTIHNPSTIIIRNSAFRGPIASGFTVTHSTPGTTINLRDCVVSGVSGTFLNLTGATCNTISVSRNTLTTSGTILSGGTVLVGGTICDNIFNGSGDFIAGLTESTPLWLWSNNLNVPGTSIFPGAAITLLPPEATLSDMINKINELVAATNGIRGLSISGGGILDSNLIPLL